MLYLVKETIHKRTNLSDSTECEVPKTVKFVERERRMVAARGQGRGRGRGVVFSGARVSICEDDKALGMVVRMVVQQCECP